MGKSAVWVGIVAFVALLVVFPREAPVLVVAFLLFAILAGFGRALGLPLLFWRTTHGQHDEKARARFLVGMAVGAVLAAGCFVGCLSEVTLQPATRNVFYWAFGISCFVAGICLVVLSLPGIRAQAHQHVASVVRSLDGGSADVELIAPVGGNASEWTAWQLPVGGVFGILGLWGAAVLLSLHLPALLWQQLPLSLVIAGIRAPREAVVELASLHVTGAFLLAAGLLVYAVLWFRNWNAGRELGSGTRKELYPAVAVCLVLVGVVVIHGFLVVRSESAAGTLSIALLVYAALNGRFQRASARGLARPDAGVPDAAPAGRMLLPDDQALDAWRAQHGEKPTLVVVAADGGGIRAALWTATVLTSLEERRPSFSKHVRLITGASGGMLGATYWTATLGPAGTHLDRPPAGDPPGPSGELTGPEILDRVQTGGLSAVVSGLVFRDLWPPPLRKGRDRGTALEFAWQRNCPKLEDSIGTLAEGEEAGWRPSVVLTPMVVEDGRRFVISNLDLGALLRHEAATFASTEKLSRSCFQVLEEWPWAAKTLALSTAIRLQANFPWVLPSTEVPALTSGGPRCRVVDAGYYDETGVDLACAWIRCHLDYLRKETSGVVLLQIRDTSSIGRDQLPQTSRATVARGLDGLLTPVSAVLRARDATNWYRNDAGVEDLWRRWQAARGTAVFATEIAEFGGEASLSWSLTDEEARAIRGFVANPKVKSVLDRIANHL